MNLTRRNFLKALGIGAGSAMVGGGALLAKETAQAAAVTAIEAVPSVMTVQTMGTSTDNIGYTTHTSNDWGMTWRTHIVDADIPDGALTALWVQE